MTGGKTTLPATIIAFVVGQAKGAVPSNGAVPLRTIRSFPTYASHLPQFKIIQQRSATVDGLPVTIVTKAVPPENMLVEVSARVPDVLQPDVLGLKDRMLLAAEHELTHQNVETTFKEEYTLYCVNEYEGDPKKFIAHGDRIAALIKSESIKLSQAEIDKTLADGMLQYAADDVTIVDWDGAFIFDIHADWQDTVDILEISNINLLRLRHLDQQLDERLDAMSGLLGRVPKIKGQEVRQMMSDLMKLRAQSVIEFEHAERDIQLIGDWYAGRLYTLASKKLHLERWRQSIRQVLASLEGMSTMAADHFSVTSERRAEQIQQLLWYVQLLGWFVLLFLEWRTVMR